MTRTQAGAAPVLSGRSGLESGLESGLGSGFGSGFGPGLPMAHPSGPSGAPATVGASGSGWAAVLPRRVFASRAVSGRRPRGWLLLALLLLLSSAALRFGHLGRRSLWYDEAVTADASREGARVALLRTRRYSAPPLHPLLLAAVERVGRGAIAVRLPSAVASLATVLLMLVPGTAASGAGESGAAQSLYGESRYGESRIAGSRMEDSLTEARRVASFLAATLMAFSATQIRYAQEVREYALGGMVAALLLVLFERRASTVRLSAAGDTLRVLGRAAPGNTLTGGAVSRAGHPGVARPPAPPWALYAALALAPLVQYGLVFLAAAILATPLLERLSWRMARGRDIAAPALSLGEVTAGSLALALGSAVAYATELRWQMHAAGRQWYLAEDYFHAGGGLLHFAALQSASLLRFLFPGRPVDLLIALAAVLALALPVGIPLSRRALPPVVVATLLSLVFTLAAALLDLYPYGGVRQCLFLAPGIALSSGLAMAALLGRLRRPALRRAATAALLLLIAATLLRSAARMRPYGEYEDMQTLLRTLDSGRRPGDRVWVHHDAAPAFSFYRPAAGPGVFLGSYHPDPADYGPELRALAPAGTTRLWLLFSHLEQAEDRAERDRLLAGLRPRWRLVRVAAPMNAELWLATRPETDNAREAETRAGAADGGAVNWKAANWKADNREADNRDVGNRDVGNRDAGNRDAGNRGAGKR